MILKTGKKEEVVTEKLKGGMIKKQMQVPRKDHRPTRKPRKIH